MRVVFSLAQKDLTQNIRVQLPMLNFLFFFKVKFLLSDLSSFLANVFT